MAYVEATQFVVMVDGTDVSTRFASRLITLDVRDNSGENADTCQIHLDDTGGMISMPQEGAHVVVILNGGQVFDGIVDDVKAIYDRGSGHTLEIEAKSADMKGKQKSPKQKHWDNKTVKEAIEDAGEDADIDVDVDEEVGKTERKYIAQDNESALHFITRMSNENGGTFKMVGGKKGVVLNRNSGKTAGSGSPIGNVIAMKGDNLITANISPILTRPRFKEVRSRWFDQKKSKWMEEISQVEGIDDADGAAQVRHSKQDTTEAKASGKSGSKESKRNKGSGTVIIDGDPMARAEALCTVVGVRPGVDGTYVIDMAEHKLERGSGYQTTMTLRMPEDAKDDRENSKSKGSPKDAGDSKSGTGGDVPWEPLFAP